MRHLATLAAAGLAAGLAATGCGAATNVLQGRTPAQIVQLASTEVVAQSYRLSLDGKFSVDVSGVQGLPAGVLDQVSAAMKTFTLSGKGDVQNAQRMRTSLTMAMGSLGDKTMVGVLYDGRYYLSQDGGKTFADVGTLSLQGVATSPSDMKAVLNGATDVKDLGATIRDGQHVEHLHATLGSSYISDMISKITGSGSAASAMQQFGSLFAQVITVRNGSVDLYVRNGDGRVESIDSGMTMALDMGKLVSVMTHQFGGQVPSGSGIGQVSGSMVLTMTDTNRFTDYGAKITVSKPTVDPSVPGLPSLFGGGTTGA